MGALSRAFAGGMRTLHVFGLCVALPLCAERNMFEGAVADGMRTLHVFGLWVALPLCAERKVFEGARSLMACAHCMPASALPASCMLVACTKRLYVGGTCTSWEVSAHG